MKKDCIIKFKIAGWTISDSMISIKGSLVDTDKSKLGILDSTGIAPCPSFIVEPITDAMDVDALEENGKDGIIDPFADDEIEEMNEKNAVVILAEDSQALPIVSPVKKETETMKKSAMKKGKVAPVILAQDSQEYLSQEVPATQEVAIKPKKEKKSKQDLKEKVKEKVEEEKQEVVVPQKKVKKSASSKKQAAGNEDGENEMMKSPESLVAAIIEPIAEKDAHKKSKSKSKTKVPKGPEETAKDEVESKVKKANSEITESQSATVLETLKEKKSAKKRKSPEDGGDSSKKSKKKGKKTAQ